MTTDRIYFGALESYQDLVDAFPLVGGLPSGPEIFFAWSDCVDTVVVYERDGSLYLMDDDLSWSPVRTTWPELSEHFFYGTRDTRVSRSAFRALVDSHVRSLDSSAQVTQSQEVA